MAHMGGRLCETRIQRFSVALGGKKVISDINVNFHCGEITALIGPNGAGKTTFLRALLGLLPVQGTLSFSDADGHPARKPIIGYVPQRMDFDRLAPGSVADLFAACLSRFPAFLGIGKATRERARSALEATDAAHLLDSRPGAISGGELQRVLLALALTPTPDLLLLDEPVSGVDATGLARFYQTVDDVRRKLDLTCVWVSHDLHAVKRYADRVLLLGFGKLEAIGSPRDVFATEAFRTLYGEELAREVNA